VFGEFSDIVYDVIKLRVGSGPSALTLGGLNALLDRLVAAPDPTAKAKVFEEEVGGQGKDIRTRRVVCDCACSPVSGGASS